MKKIISVVFGLLMMVSFCFARDPSIIGRPVSDEVIFEGSMKLYDSAIPDGDYFVKVSWHSYYDYIKMHIMCFEKNLSDNIIDCGSTTSSPLLQCFDRICFYPADGRTMLYMAFVLITIKDGCLTKIWTDTQAWDEYDEYWSKALFGNRAHGRGVVKRSW